MGMADDDRILALEERLAHLIRAVEDLGDVVARQDGAIAVLERRMELVLRREAERAEAEGGAVFIDRPPHY